MKTRLVFTMLMIVSTTVSLLANRNGITGKVREGCTCHGSSPSTLTTVILDGNRIVDPGSLTNFTLRVQNSVGVYGGFNLAVYDTTNKQAGTLSPVSGEGVSLTAGELTHSSRKQTSGTPRTASWKFQWRAPSSPGYYIVHAAANAADGDGVATSNDRWNFLNPVTITVRGMTLKSPTTSVTLCASDTLILQWNSYAIATANIAYSSNGGQSWNLITSIQTKEGDNTYAWAIPANAVTSSQYKVRILNADDELQRIETPNLTVNARTTITSQPSPSEWWGCESSMLTLRVQATGANLQYQWYRGQQPVEGATTMQLSIPSIQSSQAGVYSCRVSGACGTVTSREVTVIVTAKPRIVAYSTDTIVEAGMRLVLYVEASGDSLQYQWRKNGTAISGATEATYSVNAASSEAEGTYVAEIRNSCDIVTTPPIRVQIKPILSVEQAPSMAPRLYPLPAQDHITIAWSNPITAFALFDTHGRLILDQQLSIPNGQINIALREHISGARLAPGIYILKIHTSTKTQTLPLILTND